MCMKTQLQSRQQGSLVWALDCVRVEKWVCKLAQLLKVFVTRPGPEFETQDSHGEREELKVV